jgi:hypothetical protein
VPVIKRHDATDEDMLYELYSLDFLKYLMDMLYQLKARLDTLLPKSDPIRDKKIMVYRYEIVARFCQLAESLGGLIIGFNMLDLESNKQLTKGHATKVLTYLSNYSIKEIGELYKRVDADSLRYDVLFGYDVLDGMYADKVSLSLKNIKLVLKEIYDCYTFFKESYNAYKHGYRLWVGKDQSNNMEAVIFRDKRNFEFHVPIDDKSLDIVLKSGKYCLNIFDLIKSNHKAIMVHLHSTQVEPIRMKFVLSKDEDPQILTVVFNERP